MFAHQGICVDSWVKVEDNCNIRCEIVGDEAQFRLGGSSGGLEIIFTEGGLATLVTVGAAVLERMRVEADEEEHADSDTEMESMNV